MSKDQNKKKRDKKKPSKNIKEKKRKREIQILPIHETASQRTQAKINTWLEKS